MSWRDTIRKLRDGDSAFALYPDDIAHFIRDNLLHNIEAGELLTDRLLPYLEGEAIARLEKHTGARPTYVPDRRADPDGWRTTWVRNAWAGDAAAPVQHSQRQPSHWQCGA